MSSKKKQMVINYVPGEECRVAIVDSGRLEEFHAERMDGPSNHVGNIYVGKVMNVEQSIQAAFVDFGLEQNGFLHTSDVHPQYFPTENGGGDGKKERVGRKTPRRERPPIQDCFRRGDEVAVQVLKEGVGTKGPTVTSYLSIPGRFLVMMPQMDKVGVSRKVEDEDTRRKMREILDQLDLPEGFGFILRTAGMERSKAELKRDLAYLMRLWKDMEKRWKSGNKPRLLYSESDLLVRALRDLLTADIDEVVVDNEAALSRAARFLKIVAPRTSTRLVHYTGKSPIFHVMGLEPQIQMIHAREVPLESGGRLVIDEAEALVAIDVNSGKSRDARDSETNAYQTNLEAVDEICRQLRLRDLGGVIVNDLIDMRSAKHRREIEQRFAENLKKDRARWTIAPISEFGILEMTRQRMRASHESQHFTDCPTCRGRGLVQRPDSVAGDALRELAALLDSQSVQRVELVVHPRIAGELLSTKRRALGRLERTSGKHVDVRVSEAIPVDRVTFYAYDERGADLDIPKLGHRRAAESELVNYEIASDASEEWTVDQEQPVEPEQYPDEIEAAAEAAAHPIELEPLSLAEVAAQDRARHQQRQHPHHQHGQHGHNQHAPEGGEFAGEPGEGGRRRRRRRGRRGRGGNGGQPHGQPGQFAGQDGEPYGDPNAAPYQGEQSQYDQQSYGEGEYAPVGGPGAPQDGEQPYDPAMNGAPGPQHGHSGEPGQSEQGDGRRRRRRRGRRGRGGQGGPDGQPYPEQGSQYQGEQGHEGQPYEGEPYAEQPIGEAPAGEPQYDEPGMEGDGFHASHEHPGAQQSEHQEQPQGQHGPGGFDQGGPGGGEGGGRRRRRGRRGRGGNRGPDGQGVQSGQGGQRTPRRTESDQPSLASMFRDTTPESAVPQGDGYESGEEQSGNFEPSQANELQGEFASGDQPDGASAEQAGGRRRRRGRRGGRGRGEEDRGQPRGEFDGGGEPPSPQAPRDQPVPRSQPVPQAPASSPKIRTLYGSRRRIAPGDIKNTKRED